MTASNTNFAYPEIDSEIKRIVTAKQKAKNRETNYDNPQHSVFIGGNDWTLLNCVIRKKLGYSHMPRSLDEGNLVLAENDRDLMTYLSRSKEEKQILTPQELAKLNNIGMSFDPQSKYNKIFSEMLAERISAMPDNTTCIMPVNISSASGIEQGQAHVISVGIRKDKDRLHVSLYESMPIEEPTRRSQAVLIGQILQSLLPQFKVATNGMPCGPQDGADCSLHAVFNAALNEKGNNQTLTFGECSQLRKALDDFNKTVSLANLDSAVTRILASRKLMLGTSASTEVKESKQTVPSPTASTSGHFKASTNSSSSTSSSDSKIILDRMQRLYNKYLEELPTDENQRTFIVGLRSLLLDGDLRGVAKKLEEETAPFIDTAFGAKLGELHTEVTQLLPKAPTVR